LGPLLFQFFSSPFISRVYIYLPDDLLRVELAYNTEPFLEAHNVDVKFIHFNANLQIHESKKMAKRKCLYIYI